MFCCPKKKNNGLVQASVANGALVVTYKGPEAPRVWRGSLAFTSTAALEMQESDGVYRLVMKVAGGPTEEILSLKDKAVVVSAFDEIATLLAQDHGGGHGHAGGGFWRFLKKLFWFAIILGLVFLSLPIFFAKQSPLVTGEKQGAAQQQEPAKAGPKAGVPVPADDIFGE